MGLDRVGSFAQSQYSINLTLDTQTKLFEKQIQVATGKRAQSYSQLAGDTNRLVSVEEGWAFAGIGAELAAQMMEVAFDWLDAPVSRVAGADVPMPYAANLEKLALPSVEHIVQAAKDTCYR